MNTRQEVDQRYPCYLGVDGGGSKTVAVLVDAHGHECGRGQGGSANHQGVGLERAVQSIAAAIGQATQALPSKEYCIRKGWFGLAGVDRPADFTLLYPHLQSFAQEVHITNDAELNLSALPDRIGVTLIAGTGSIALGRNQQGQSVRAGGWGHLLGDEGSGYDLGIKALQAAVKAADGRGERTVLLELIMEHWHIQQPSEIIGQTYRADNKKSIAQLSTCVLQAAQQQDQIAHTIVQQAAYELALTVRAVSRQLGFQPEQEIALALGGGLLCHALYYQQQVLAQIRVQQALRQVISVEQPALSAACGVMQLTLVPPA